MALFGFLTRNPQRDRETDRARFDRLLQSLDAFDEEIRKEHDGLRNRYEAASVDAAYAQQALEDGAADKAVSPRIDDLTGAIIRYSQRISTLESESALIGELRERVIRFTQANGFENKDLQPQRPSVD